MPEHDAHAEAIQEQQQHAPEPDPAKLDIRSIEYEKSGKSGEKDRQAGTQGMFERRLLPDPLLPVHQVDDTKGGFKFQVQRVNDDAAA